MVKYSVALLGLVASVHAAPFVKRIAQTIDQSTTKWVQACESAGGGEQCNPLSVTAFGTLLAGAGPCDQQNAADSLVSLGKQLNSAEMVSLAQIFAQQPRNSPNSVSIPYCQQAPQNAELNGLFQCQFAGVNMNTFVGGVAVGGPGTIPFGRTSPVSPPGSCPANPGGPVPNGQQLVDITTNPNAPGGTGVSGNGNASTPPASSTPSPTAEASTPAASPAASTSGSGSSSSSFQLQNGKDAQALNAKFAGLTASSSCTAGEDACVNGGFAQCVGGTFVVTPCAATLTCAALPLVNSPGTSIACTTQADALSRIQNTGATGGLTG